MALTTNQQAELTKLKQQIADMKQEVMNSPQCTMGGMGNYLWTAFDDLTKQADKVASA